MLNLEIGSKIEVNNEALILTRKGARGHAVYGPYDQFTPGRYLVEFGIAPVEGQRFDRDLVCAAIDVVANGGQDVLARQEIMLSSLRGGRATFVLPFTLDRPHRIEFRVGVTGAVPLQISQHRRAIQVPDEGMDEAALIEAGRFPSPSAEATPLFFAQHVGSLRHLYDSGVGVRLMGEDVILSVDGVSFFAREPDDFNFVGEVFLNNTYNVLLRDDSCVIDIGMNIALVSLLLAAKPSVKEVHSFEPFQQTFNRATANIALNPALAAKITTYPAGLSDRDEDATLMVADPDASGSMSIHEVSGGHPVRVQVRSAATALGPIIADARARGLKVVMKVDCEGSEFAIFRSLAEADLLKEVSAFMVEWHRMFDDKTQADLIDPLLDLGFIVFDQSNRTSNGFFYAVRAETPGRR